MTRLPLTRQHPIAREVHGTRSVTKGVVIHTIEGSDEGAISWFDNPAAGGVGAHVAVGYDPPQCHQLADLDAICWHAKGANSEYIGFEHEGRASFKFRQWIAKPKMLALSANRVGWVCYHYRLGLPTKGKNVFGHVDFPAGGHSDPGKGWPWRIYIKLCRRAYRRLLKTHGRTWK